MTKLESFSKSVSSYLIWRYNDVFIKVIDDLGCFNKVLESVWGRACVENAPLAIPLGSLN